MKKTIFAISVLLIVFGYEGVAQNHTNEDVYAHNLGEGIQFILWNSAVLTRYAEELNWSRGKSVSEMKFWAYQFKGEVAFANRYVLQGRILRGTSAAIRSTLIPHNVGTNLTTHTIVNVGVGYRFTFLHDKKNIHPYVGYAATFLVNYKSVLRADRQNAFFQTRGLEVALQGTARRLWDFLVLEVGAYFMPISRVSSVGVDLPRHRYGFSLHTSTGIGIELSQYITLLLSFQRDNVRHRFENDVEYTVAYPSMALTLKTML